MCIWLTNIPLEYNNRIDVATDFQFGLYVYEYSVKVNNCDDYNSEHSAIICGLYPGTGLTK